MFFEAFLNGFAILSTVVATLRAGSRVAYIVGNGGAIGLVDGPRIVPPPTTEIISFGGETTSNSTETSSPTTAGDGADASEPTTKDPYNPALYELAENFKRCVKISASGATEEPFHGCENLLRNRLINPLAPASTEGTDPKRQPKDSIVSKGLLNGGFRRVWDEVRSFAEEQMREQSKKDPFGEKAYTLGYAHYAPKTFREIADQQVLPRLVTYEEPFDFEFATEADYYYHAVSASPDGTSKRRRLAELKAYCPKLFGDLRSSMFGISEEDYLKSVLGTMVSFQSNSKGAARAGGIFFFTSDGAYMIKTIPDREKKTLLKILPDYHDHMKRYGRTSLLTRFCGMYGITIEEEDEASEMGDSDGDSSRDILGVASEDGSSSFAPTGKEYTFVVMNAVFPAKANAFVSERFDLKGSTVGREVSREELESKGSMAVLKDLDLSREVDLVRAKHKQRQQEEEERLFWKRNRSRWWGINRRPNRFDAKKRRAITKGTAGFTIGATAKAALLSQLRKDVHFLTKCQVMDYSLLVGVVNRDNAVGGYSTGREGSNSTAGAPDNVLTPEIVDTIREQNAILERLETSPSAVKPYEFKPNRLRKLDADLFYTLTAPARLMLSPPLYIARRTWEILRLTLGSIVTHPMPYYGSGQCGVDGGKLSILHGKRRGARAVYYLGLIDFLQPWTTRKVMERKLKGLAGYDTDAISAVTPEEYATRFLEFLDRHIS